MRTLFFDRHYISFVFNIIELNISLNFFILKIFSSTKLITYNINFEIYNV